jgi:hypothetical protein
VLSVTLLQLPSLLSKISTFLSFSENITKLFDVEIEGEYRATERVAVVQLSFTTL